MKLCKMSEIFGNENSRNEKKTSEYMSGQEVFPLSLSEPLLLRLKLSLSLTWFPNKIKYIRGFLKNIYHIAMKVADC